MSIEILAPAKINLSLAVTQTRSDGFHNLQTVFQAVSLFDRIKVTLTDWGITCMCGSLSGEKNLAYRAAEAFWRTYQDRGTLKKAGVDIEIEKGIPIQAGLGGGSSDAAAVLLALNQLLGSPLSYNELLRCALQCGSDTAFFLKGGTQWGEGTGTDLTDLPAAPAMDLILVKPPVGINTGIAYRTFDQKGHYGSLNKKKWIDLFTRRDIPGIGQSLFNSLESAAFTISPEIEAVKQQLLAQGCLGALMSGSGSVVFGILRTPEQGEAIAKEWTGHEGYSVWLVKTISGNRLTIN